MKVLTHCLLTTHCYLSYNLFVSYYFVCAIIHLVLLVQFIENKTGLKWNLFNLITERTFAPE